MNDDFLENVNSLKKLICDANNIVLASHINPDGDNLGSLTAIFEALKLNKKVFLLKDDLTPSNLKFLPNINEFITMDEFSEDVDLFIAVDCADVNRLGALKLLFEKSKNTVNIDHHISNTFFANINIVNHNVSSTGELIFNIMDVLSMDINKNIATSLYTAISTDTGSFMYSNTSSKTHKIASKLLEKNIDFNNIVKNLYQNNSLEASEVFIKSLGNTKFYYNNKVAIVQVDESVLLKNNLTWDATDSILSFLRGIDSVEVAILLKKHLKNKFIKVSMRSKSYVDVSKICQKFDGGGHIRAAGCSFNIDDSLAEKLLLSEIEKKLR